MVYTFFLITILALFSILLTRMIINPTKRRPCSFGARSLTSLLIASILMLALVLLIVYGWHYRWHYDIEVPRRSAVVKNPFFGIMFDAGSTGSRIHVFKFSRPEKDDIYELVEELFEKVQPGLSAYGSDPVKGAESLRPMLEKARKYIPADKWSETPIALKATAGLRLLPNETSTAILKEVEKLFRTFSFKMSDNGISLLDGTDEGIFCWFTVNFLHGKFGKTSGTMGMLDLGGGSTQITFVAPANKVHINSGKHLMEVKLFGRLHNLYSRSYLGLGMNSARFQAIGGREVTGGVHEGMFHSPCLPDNYSGVWAHGGHEHHLRNSLNSTKPRFLSCYAAVRQVILSHDVERVASVSNTTFCGLSFYVDRALDTKLVGDPEGGTIMVGDFYRQAQKHCKQVTNDDPFRCLDLCYISALLQDGFGFHRSSSIVVRKRLNSVELAWPLGAMFDVYGKFTRQTVVGESMEKMSAT